MNVILFGPPGSGKGTQAERLRNRFVLKHISTGDLLRAAIAEKNELGRKVEAVLASGELVSDDIVLDLIRVAVAEVDEDPELNGWLVDGFPRTLGQAEGFDRLLEQTGHRIDAIIVLEVGPEVILERLLKRGRADDTAETVSNRIDVYQAQTRPTLEYYDGRVPIHRIDGARSMDAVTADIESALQ